MPRIHSERDCFDAFAAISYERSSFGVDRTRTVALLALPFGSAGRPTLLGLDVGIIPKLLNDEGSHGGYRRYYRRNVKHRYMLCWLGRVACIVQPCISRIRLGMALQVEHFHDAIPDRPALKHFFDRYALCVRCGAAVQLVLSTFAM